MERVASFLFLSTLLVFLVQSYSCIDGVQLYLCMMIGADFIICFFSVWTDIYCVLILL